MELFAPGVGVAEGDAGGVGFVTGERASVAEERHDGAGHLFFARAACANHGLFDAQWGVFKNVFSQYGGGGYGGAAGGAEDLGGLEVLYVNGLFQGDVADGEVGDE